ncbi:hypothetical protein Slin15195_G119920 [Septoria linicola]|uniref:Uncharacterized protein n=1 Tax=Septoria linicola TaxID=215465 RepID=A0A9Q9B496_9PEZI|nr:hypothetical protein Slin14017_G096910 [Septoria linicola]USW58673.1 hypothetical protein Slin15195_G119920 [Septoria linicola]
MALHVSAPPRKELPVIARAPRETVYGAAKEVLEVDVTGRRLTGRLFHKLYDHKKADPIVTIMGDTADNPRSFARSINAAKKVNGKTTKLELIGSPFINNDILPTLLKHFPHLEELPLVECDQYDFNCAVSASRNAFDYLAS